MSGIENDSIDSRVLALGGMLQALAQVRRIADTGQSETAPVQVALDSVFRIDAADTHATTSPTAIATRCWASSGWRCCNWSGASSARMRW